MIARARYLRLVLILAATAGAAELVSWLYWQSIIHEGH